MQMNESNQYHQPPQQRELLLLFFVLGNEPGTTVRTAIYYVQRQTTKRYSVQLFWFWNTLLCTVSICTVKGRRGAVYELSSSK